MADNDTQKRRSRLIQPLTLLLITAVLVLALVLLFPARRFSELTHTPEPEQEEPSSVSISYLQALLRANPQDEQLRINLAMQQARAGEIDHARQTLDPVQDVSDADVQWLLLDLDWQAFNGAEKGSPEREENRGRVIARMRELQGRSGLSPQRRATLANRWLALGQPAQAAAIYDRLGEEEEEEEEEATEHQNSYQWYALAARWWLAANEPGKASESWRRAFESTDDPEQRRTAALAALDAARQDDDADNLDLAQRFIDAYPKEPTFLDIGIDMALARNRLEIAQQWSKRYISIRPGDQDARERDAQIALARNELGEALTGLQQLVENNPDNAALRAKLAQVQIWAGQPQAALANYERLARNASDDEYDNQIVDLATDLHDTAAVLAALDRIRQRHPLDAEHRKLLVDILNSEGQPDRAIATIQQWVEGGRADRGLWVRLATLQEQTGDLAGALHSWEQISDRYGRALDETQARSRLLVRLWRLEDALAVLRSLPDQPGAQTEAEAFYWNTIGELGWNLNEKTAARDAYYELFLDRKLDANGYMRLIQLAGETGQVDRAMRVTRADWRENKHAEGVVAMLNIAQVNHRDEYSRELLGYADNRPTLFADLPDYWQLYGDYYFDQRELDRARVGYLRALELAPGQVSARNALMYTLAESGRDQELRRYVHAWAPSAWFNPNQWQAFAMAYSRLGETKRALPWFDKAVRSDPDNYLLALDYADALEAGRRFDSARRMREYAVTELRPRLLRDLERQGALRPERREQNVRILSVQAAMLGPDASRGWLRQALGGRQGATLNPTDVEMLLGYYLSEEEPAYARYWLLQAHRRRVATEDWQELAVALQDNDQVAMQRILRDAGPGGGSIGIADRISALRQLDYRARALTLALNHENPREPFVTGSDVVPRYAAELYQQMPQNYGTQLSVRRLSDLDVTEESAFLRLSGEKLSARLELGARQLSDEGIGVDLAGLDDERFANLELNWRERRGLTTVRVGTVSADAEDIVQLGLRQDWQLTDHVAVALFGDYNELPTETGELRVLGVRDQVGGTVDWTLNPRDSVSLTAAYSTFYSREGRDRLGDGYNIEASVAHSLMVGPTHQIQIRGFANTEQNFLEDDLPDQMADRLPEGTNLDDVVPTRYTFVGAGVTFARGIPGDEYPVVASPRYQLNLDTGYVLPDGDIGLSASFSIGSRVLGSDELSLNLGVDQTGSDTRQNSYTGMIKYQYFLGR